MEAPEKPGTAKAITQWFAGRTAPQASAHYNIDNIETWQSVKEKDVAWAAPGANRSGIHLEHAGYARQGPAEWADPYSETMLARSAQLAADLCTRHNIPVAFVQAAGLLAGERGITTHAEVSKAWRQSTHSDPGPHFPMAHYLNLVREAMAPPPQEVAPMYDPPLGPIAAVWQDEVGRVIAAVSPDGDVYAWGCPFVGGVKGEDFWGARKAAAIGPPKVAGKVYCVTSTSGETYNLPK